MSLQNLATVIGPNILRSAEESAGTAFFLNHTGAINMITLDLLQNHEVLFLPPNEFHSQFTQFENVRFIKLTKVLYPYKPRFSSYFENEPTEMALKEITVDVGNVVFIDSVLPYDDAQESDSGWWHGEVVGFNHQRGIAPSNYLQVLQEF
jgi:hypothetical protein